MNTLDIQQPDITSSDFVGRKRIRETIDKAINDHENLSIVNIQGDGGIGKTSVLRWVEKQYGEKDKPRDSEFSEFSDKTGLLLVTSTIDFFDPAVRDKRGFFETIYQELKQGNENIFAELETILADYGELKVAGVSSVILKREQEKIINQFNNSYAELAKRSRIVILIDTFELVQDDLGEWLADWFTIRPNTCAIIAGRKNGEWQPILEKAVDPSRTVFHQLGEFSDTDTEELFTLSKAGKLLGEEVRLKIQLLTNGIPVLLAMTLDWQERDIPIDDLTRTSGQYTLDELRQKSESELDQIRENFKREMIERFMDPSDHNNAIKCMAIAYKYFPYKLATHLLDIPSKEARDLLDKLSEWSFIKFNQRLESYQLHDMVREMILEHVWTVIDFERETRRQIYQKVVEYYCTLISELKSKEELYQQDKPVAFIEENKPEKGKIAINLLNIRKIRQYREIERVHYDLLSKDELSLGRYLILFAEFVWARERKVLKRLRRERDEAFGLLGVTYPKTRLLFEEARIKIVIDGNFTQGIKLIEDDILPKVNQGEEQIFYAGIRLYQGIAYHSKGENTKGEELLIESINKLKELEKEYKYPEDSNKANWQRIIRLLSRAYMNLGYLRFTIARYSEAIPPYKEAIHYSNTAGMSDIKSAAQNDLSYIYARQGDYEIARELCLGGLRIREDLGNTYYVGLSYNTLGQIEFMADYESLGATYCRQALDIFSQMKEKRGMMLANRALGLNLAKHVLYLHRLGKHGEAMEKFNVAEKHLRESEIFAVKGQEVKYFMEINLYFGLLYQNRAIIAEDTGHAESSIYFFRKSESCYRQAIDYAIINESNWAEIYNRERLFSLYHRMGSADLAGHALKEMETAFARAGMYFLGKTDETPKIPSSDYKNREYLYLCGKLLRGRGRMAFRLYSQTKESQILKKTAEHYTLACAFTEMFSKNANGMKTTCREVLSLINRLDFGEAKIFQDHIAQTTQKCGLNQYSELNKWLEKAAGLL